MLGFGWAEWAIILVIIVIIFGASRLPEVGRGLGKGIQEFKKSVKNDPDSPDQVDPDEDQKKLSE